MRVRVLGPVEVIVGERRLELGAAKQRALLAMLALHANRTVPADRLVEGVWGEPAPPTAAKMVQNHVSRLRKILAAGDGAAAEIVTRGRGYELRIAADDVDALRFERLVAEGRSQQALALWRGPPLADVADEPFAAAEIRRLEELRLTALERTIAADVDEGRHGEAVSALTALLAEHPVSERLHGLLMLALYRSGRQADALEAYRLARATLVEQVGVEPGPELRRLHAAILQQDASLDGPTGARLPVELEITSPLIGRDAELGRLRRAWDGVRRGGGAAVMISGPEGIGKTRLVAELAGEVHRQGARVLFGPDAIATAREARRPTLLVLDDADPAGPALDGLGELMRERPVLAIVVTRGPPGATRLAVVAQVELAALDVAAVAAIAALYAPSGANPPARDLARRSGGVPQLAHQLAAEWSRAEAARALGPVAVSAAAERNGLRRAERRLEDKVLELHGVLERTEPAPPAAGVVCPFKGLASFGVEDADFFFGRERLVAEMVARLVGSPLLAVVGASGSGKSSAVRAGLLCELARGVLPGSERWTQVVLRPGERPLRALESAVAAAPAGAPRLIVVDQFEEAFTLCGSPPEREAFVEHLLVQAGDRDRCAAVVIAVRADYYGRCAEDPALARLVGANHVLVGAMKTDELRRAIELPAARAGLRLDPGLADRLLEDARGEPGALPLLSSALLELWQSRDGRDLRLAAYERTGGVRGAVARVAERAYARLDADQQQVARRLLARLAADDPAGRTVRRPMALAKLDDRAEAVTEALAADRLITVGDGTVEVAHEALFTEWPRLRGWLQEDADGRRLHARLAHAARDWDLGGRDPVELYRGSRLAAALEWRIAHERELDPTERAFLDAGRVAGQRARRRLQIAFAAAVALLAAAATAAVVAITQTRRAEAETSTAVSRGLAAEALGQRAEDLNLAALLSLEAYRAKPTVDARNAVLTMFPDLDRELGRKSFRPVGPPLHSRATLFSLAFNSNGTILAGADGRGTVRRLDIRTGRPIGPPLVTHTRPGDAVFNHDDTVVAFAYGSRAGTPFGVRLWDIADRRPLGPPLQGRTAIHDMAFNTAGTRLVTADGLDGTVRLWDVRSGRALGPAFGSGPDVASVDHVAINPEGTVVAAAGQERLAPDQPLGGTVRLLDIATRGPLGPPLQDGALITDVAFNRDGTTVAAGAADGTIQLWNVTTRRPLGPPLKVSGNGPVAGVSFTPDGRTLASSSFDAGNHVTLRFWDIATRSALGEPETVGGPGLAFAPDGGTLASAGDHDTASLWSSLLWSADPRRLHSGICAALTQRNLTRQEWQQYLPGTRYHATCG